MEIVKIGPVELYLNEAIELYQSGKYIVTYSRIYQLFYSNAQKTVYGIEIFYHKGMARRGRFYALTASDVNHLVGFNLVIDPNG